MLQDVEMNEEQSVSQKRSQFYSRNTEKSILILSLLIKVSPKIFLEFFFPILGSQKLWIFLRGDLSIGITSCTLYVTFYKRCTSTVRDIIMFLRTHSGPPTSEISATKDDNLLVRPETAPEDHDNSSKKKKKKKKKQNQRSGPVGNFLARRWKRVTKNIKLVPSRSRAESKHAQPVSSSPPVPPAPPTPPTPPTPPAPCRIIPPAPPAPTLVTPAQKQSAPSNIVVEFSRVASLNLTIADVGAKGLRLAELTSVLASSNLQQSARSLSNTAPPFRVPPGACLITSAFDAHLSSHLDIIRALEEVRSCVALGSSSTSSSSTSSKKLTSTLAILRASILSSTLDQKTEEDVRSFVEDTMASMSNPLSARFAVRSSGSMEDLASKSFAGQYDSVLNVLPENVPNAIKRCWASQYGDHVVPYLQDALELASAEEKEKKEETKIVSGEAKAANKAAASSPSPPFPIDKSSIFCSQDGRGDPNHGISSLLGCLVHD